MLNNVIWVVWLSWVLLGGSHGSLMHVGGGGVSQGSSNTGISERSSDFGDRGGSNHLGGHTNGLTVHNSIESVDGVSSVLDGAPGAVRLHERIGSLDDISAAGLVLVLRVSGQSVLDIVAVAVLGIGIVIVSDDGLGNNWGGVFGNGRVSIGSYSNFGDRGVGGSVSRSKGWGGVRVHSDSGSAGHEGGKNDELCGGELGIVNEMIRWIQDQDPKRTPSTAIRFLPWQPCQILLRGAISLIITKLQLGFYTQRKAPNDGDWLGLQTFRFNNNCIHFRICPLRDIEKPATNFFTAAFRYRDHILHALFARMSINLSPRVLLGHGLCLWRLRSSVSKSKIYLSTPPVSWYSNCSVGSISRFNFQPA